MKDPKILYFDPMGGIHPVKQAYTSPVLDASDEAQFDHLIKLLLQSSHDPIEELSGYLVTEDPTYLPELPEAKALIRHIGRDKLLRMMLTRILDAHKQNSEGADL